MLPLKCNGRRRKIDPRHLEHPRFYTKEGWLTPYALACGYIEQKDYGPVRISLFRDGYAYYVKACDHEQKIWRFLEAARNVIACWEQGDLAEAVRALDAAIRQAEEAHPDVADARRAGGKEVPVCAPDVLVLGAAKAMSYGPRMEPYDDGFVVPAESAEDAEFWSVYEWRTSKYVLGGGWWEWIADCDTEDVARKIAEVIARG